MLEMTEKFMQYYEDMKHELEHRVGRLAKVRVILTQDLEAGERLAPEDSGVTSCPSPAARKAAFTADIALEQVFS